MFSTNNTQDLLGKIKELQERGKIPCEYRK
jgi:hypothetical protein